MAWITTILETAAAESCARRTSGCAPPGGSPDVCVERPMRRDLHVVWKTSPLGECGASETGLSRGCARPRIQSPQSAIRRAALRRQGAGDAEHREQVANRAPSRDHTKELSGGETITNLTSDLLTGRPMAETFDLIVIGTGSGGSAPAYRCRAAGWRVGVLAGCGRIHCS